VKKTKLLPGFSAHLFGSAKRSLQEQIIRQRRKLAFCGLSDLALLFESLIPSEFLNKVAVDKRKSVYTEIVVFWAWLGQILLLNASCKKAVTMIRAWCKLHGMSGPKENNAGKLIRKHLVTTLLDAEKYPWEELVSLYLGRWDIELRFRDIKTTMGFGAWRS